MEDFEEDEVEFLVEEEDEVADLCNVIIVEYQDMIRDISQNYKHNVLIVLLWITLLRTVYKVESKEHSAVVEPEPELDS